MSLVCSTWYSVSHVHVWYRELVRWYRRHTRCVTCVVQEGSVGIGGRGGVSVSRLRLRKLLEYNHHTQATLDYNHTGHYDHDSLHHDHDSSREHQLQPCEI